MAGGKPTIDTPTLGSGTVEPKLEAIRVLKRIEDSLDGNLNLGGMGMLLEVAREYRHLDK